MPVETSININIFSNLGNVFSQIENASFSVNKELNDSISKLNVIQPPAAPLPDEKYFDKESAGGAMLEALKSLENKEININNWLRNTLNSVIKLPELSREYELKIETPEVRTSDVSELNTEIQPINSDYNIELPSLDTSFSSDINPPYFDNKQLSIQLPSVDSRSFVDISIPMITQNDFAIEIPDTFQSRATEIPLVSFDNLNSDIELPTIANYIKNDIELTNYQTSFPDIDLPSLNFLSEKNIDIEYQTQSEFPTINLPQFSIVASDISLSELTKQSFDLLLPDINAYSVNIDNIEYSYNNNISSIDLPQISTYSSDITINNDFQFIDNSSLPELNLINNENNINIPQYSNKISSEIEIAYNPNINISEYDLNRNYNYELQLDLPNFQQNVSNIEDVNIETYDYQFELPQRENIYQDSINIDYSNNYMFNDIQLPLFPNQESNIMINPDLIDYHDSINIETPQYAPIDLNSIIMPQYQPKQFDIQLPQLQVWQSPIEFQRQDDVVIPQISSLTGMFDITMPMMSQLYRDVQSTPSLNLQSDVVRIAMQYGSDIV